MQRILYRTSHKYSNNIIFESGVRGLDNQIRYFTERGPTGGTRASIRTFAFIVFATMSPQLGAFKVPAVDNEPMVRFSELSQPGMSLNTGRSCRKHIPL